MMSEQATLDEIMRLLACPYDHSGLSGTIEAGLLCASCGRTYPIVNGVINFLAHDQEFRSLTYDLPHHPVPSISWRNRLLTRIRRLPIYPRLLLTSDYFSFTLERAIYRAVKSHRSVLDIGCREGTNLLYCGSATVCVGIDIDLKSVLYAREMAPRNALAILASGTQLPFRDGGFDLVICCDVIEHIDRYDHLAREIARVTCPAGELILSTPDGDVRPIPAEFHVKHFTRADLLELFGPTYSTIDARSIVRNCNARQSYWELDARTPRSRISTFLMGAWTNLRYFISGYHRRGSQLRQDVTDATFIMSAARR